MLIRDIVHRLKAANTSVFGDRVIGASSVTMLKERINLPKPFLAVMPVTDAAVSENNRDVIEEQMVIRTITVMAVFEVQSQLLSEEAIDDAEAVRNILIGLLGNWRVATSFLATSYGGMTIEDAASDAAVAIFNYRFIFPESLNFECLGAIEGGMALDTPVQSQGTGAPWFSVSMPGHTTTIRP